MTTTSPPGTQGATRELDAYREPADGDYVAYLEMLERHKLAQLSRGHPMLAASMSATPSHPGKTPAKSSTAADFDALLAQFETARSKVGKFGIGQVVAVVVGVVLLLVTLVGEGSVVTFLIGIGLLWGPIRRLRSLWRELSPASNRTMIDTTFGKSNKKT